MKTTPIIAIAIALLFLTLTGATFAQPPHSLTIPPAPVRQPAEFDPMTGVLIAYPFGLTYPIIKEMAENETVCTIVNSLSTETTVLNLYTANGVNTAHCTFLIAPTDTYWTRDYGPWFVLTGDNQQSIIDFTYNRPRPNDDQIPTKYGQNQSIPIYNMPLTTTGGNYMCDGQGNAISTTLVWEENSGLTHDQINQTMHDYCGINRYMVVPDVNPDYIKHVDCWGKYLSPDTILIRSVPPTHSQYTKIEAAVAYFRNQTSCYGTPYHVVRVYTPLDEPYSNSLILNNKVYVPMMGDAYDAAALQSYRDAMPGYEVLGFTGSWVSTDAIHCRAMGITDRYMLYIQHIPLQNQTASASGFPVTATVHAYSGQSLLTGSPSVVYKVNNGSWNTITMTSTGGDGYTATIPSQPGGSKVSYYIHAEDASGRHENHPYIGAAGAHSFMVIGQPNHAPATPQRPDGAGSGKPGQPYTYTTMTTDPDNDSLLYKWDWGDGTMSDWLGPSASGVVVNASHTWAKKGTYSVKVMAKDSYGLETDWSDPLAVKMPYSWLDRLHDLFPVLYWLLVHLCRW